MLFFIVPLVLFIGFCINWLFTKGIILVVKNLFNVDWSNKFWWVFLGLLLIGWMFGGKLGKTSS